MAWGYGFRAPLASSRPRNDEKRDISGTFPSQRSWRFDLGHRVGERQQPARAPCQPMCIRNGPASVFAAPRLRRTWTTGGRCASSPCAGCGSPTAQRSFATMPMTRASAPPELAPQRRSIHHSHQSNRRISPACRRLRAHGEIHARSPEQGDLEPHGPAMDGVRGALPARSRSRASPGVALSQTPSRLGGALAPTRPSLPRC